MEDIGSIVSVICDSSSYLRMAGPALKAIAKVRLLFLRELQFPDQLLIVRKPRENWQRRCCTGAEVDQSVHVCEGIGLGFWVPGFGVAEALGLSCTP